MVTNMVEQVRDLGRSSQAEFDLPDNRTRPRRLFSSNTHPKTEQQGLRIHKFVQESKAMHELGFVFQKLARHSSNEIDG
jgi:hypothetical protein